MRRFAAFFFATTIVASIVPPFGYAPTRVSARLSATEVSVVRRLQQTAMTWNIDTPLATDAVQWMIEPSAATSPTLRVGRRILLRARQLLAQFEVGSKTPTWIIVGRTQSFLRDSVHSLGCEPDLSMTDGRYLMGLTTCNRRVIIINLTGYLFIRATGQTISAAMESRSEPPIAATAYTIAMRNLTALAHEWAHVARDKLTEGFVPDNEPSWFREGLAEVVSGLAMVRAYPRRADYREYHVIRIRKFMDWSHRCFAPLSTYRDGRLPSQCIYTRGAAAMELLLARHGGFSRIAALYRDAGASGDFFASFRRAYGISIAAFEREADVYARSIRLAAS